MPRLITPPVLLLGKGKHAIKDKYKLLAAAKLANEVFTGTFTSDKRKKTYHFTAAGASPPLGDLAATLFALGGKGIEKFSWNGSELERTLDRALRTIRRSAVGAWVGAATPVRC